jgi:hypothetical protein
MAPDHSTENLKKIILWMTPAEIDTLVLLLREREHLIMAEYVLASLEQTEGRR